MRRSNARETLNDSDRNFLFSAQLPQILHPTGFPAHYFPLAGSPGLGKGPSPARFSAPRQTLEYGWLQVSVESASPTTDKRRAKATAFGASDGARGNEQHQSRIERSFQQHG
jgi:hypothetical protein